MSEAFACMPLVWIPTLDYARLTNEVGCITLETLSQGAIVGSMLLNPLAGLDIIALGILGRDSITASTNPVNVLKVSYLSLPYTRFDTETKQTRHSHRLEA